MSFSVRYWPVVAAFGAGFCSGCLFLSWYRWRRRQETEERKEAEINRVLFFPDHKTSRDSLTVTEKSSTGLSALIETLKSARETLDVCVFTLSYHDLASALISAHQEGVVVRVLTDNEQTHSFGSQVNRLRRAGIQVRLDDTSYFMHHKFVVMDRKCLVNGSLNWTAQGIFGNQENVVVTTERKIVEPFVEQFEHLWQLYNPEKLVQKS